MRTLRGRKPISPAELNGYEIVKTIHFIISFPNGTREYNCKEDEIEYLDDRIKIKNFLDDSKSIDLYKNFIIMTEQENILVLDFDVTDHVNYNKKGNRMLTYHKIPIDVDKFELHSVENDLSGYITEKHL